MMEDMEKKLAFLLAHSPHFMLKGGSSTYRKAAQEFIANGVVVREKGEWIPYLDGDSIMPERYFQCSNCGSRGWIKMRNFCPNCGADMRKGRTDETV